MEDIRKLYNYSLEIQIMHQYIINTSHAARGLIELLSTDSKESDALIQIQRSVLAKEAAFDIQFLQRQMHPSANYWHGLLSETQEERAELERKIAFLEAQILDKKHSISALSGALLQLGKQGISSVKGRPDNCPASREVCGIEVKRLIWAGRNQALHYEEPKRINQETIDVFTQLNSHPDFTSVPLTIALIKTMFSLFNKQI